MTERIPKRQLAILRQLRRNASLENASFGFPTAMVQVIDGTHEPNNKPQQLDSFIKDRTRIHRESWILPLIDNLIKWGEGGTP